MTARYTLYTGRRSGAACVEVLMGALGLDVELLEAAPWTEPVGAFYEQLKTVNPLAQLPTPLEPLGRLSRQLGVNLWIKRDDQTGLAGGGNKTRKLEYLVADALARAVEGRSRAAGDGVEEVTLVGEAGEYQPNVIHAPARRDLRLRVRVRGRHGCSDRCSVRNSTTSPREVTG